MNLVDYVFYCMQLDLDIKKFNKAFGNIISVISVEFSQQVEL